MVIPYGFQIYCAEGIRATNPPMQQKHQICDMIHTVPRMENAPKLVGAQYSLYTLYVLPFVLSLIPGTSTRSTRILRY
jgi:hypothetical protein